MEDQSQLRFNQLDNINCQQERILGTTSFGEHYENLLVNPPSGGLTAGLKHLAKVGIGDYRRRSPRASG